MATTTSVKWVAWDDAEARIGRYVSVQCSRGTYYVTYKPPGMGTGEGRFDRTNIFDANELLQSGALVPLFHTHVHHKMASGPQALGALIEFAVMAQHVLSGCLRLY